MVKDFKVWRILGIHMQGWFLRHQENLASISEEVDSLRKVYHQIGIPMHVNES